MHKYKPQKRAMLIIDFFAALPVLGFNYLVKILDRFIPFSGYYIMIPLYVALLVFVIIILPIYFARAFFTVTSKEINVHGGALSAVNTFMSTSAVKSITKVQLPLSGLTGMNFIILNSLGARITMGFLSKKDMNEISAVINNSIRNRTE